MERMERLNVDVREVEIGSTKRGVQWCAPSAGSHLDAHATRHPYVATRTKAGMALLAT